MSEEVSQMLARARALVRSGADEAAKEVYLALLRASPTHFAGLNELAALASATGHRSAARSAYEQAVRFHPDNPLGRVNLATLLSRAGDLEGARAQLEAALATDPEFAPAHQGLARVLCELGDEERAAPHWRKGFRGLALAPQRYRGKQPGVPVLLLVSARGGNIATQRFLDDKTFAVTALYTDFYDASIALPLRAVVFNAIGDADLCSEALISAEKVAQAMGAPLINNPTLVRATGRAANAERLGKIPGVVTPVMHGLNRADALGARDFGFPLLLRTPGFHHGAHFVRVEREDELAQAIAALPGAELLAIQYLDVRGPDGMARKYRAMFVNGNMYPSHLAISTDWKVHYLTSAMSTDARLRAEEQRYLEDMARVVGATGMTALSRIGEALALDYAGVDFALDSSGRIIVFEANATMAANLPETNPIWDYRRASIVRVYDAAKRLVLSRAEQRVRGA